MKYFHKQKASKNGREREMWKEGESEERAIEEGKQEREREKLGEEREEGRREIRLGSTH